MNFNKKLTEFCQESYFSTLIPENAEEFSRGLHEWLRACGKVAYKTFIEGFESKVTTVLRKGMVLRFKQMTPGETSCLLGECALFHPSTTAIKHILVDSGKEIEAAKENLDKRIRKEESVPESTEYRSSKT